MNTRKEDFTDPVAELLNEASAEHRRQRYPGDLLVDVRSRIALENRRKRRRRLVFALAATATVLALIGGSILVRNPKGNQSTGLRRPSLSSVSIPGGFSMPRNPGVRLSPVSSDVFSSIDFNIPSRPDGTIHKPEITGKKGDLS